VKDDVCKIEIFMLKESRIMLYLNASKYITYSLANQVVYTFLYEQFYKNTRSILLKIWEQFKNNPSLGRRTNSQIFN